MTLDTIIAIVALLVLFFVSSYALRVRRQLRELAAKHEAVGAYARDLAEALYETHYWGDAPEWEVAHNPMEILSQIDNMVSGLTRAKSYDG